MCVGPVGRGWETEYVDAMLPRFEEETGSQYADGETFEDIHVDFFAERSGNDLVEEGNEVRLTCLCCVGP